MKLLSDISATRSCSPSSMVPTIISPEEDFAYNALVDAYSRLGIQSAMFGHVPFCKPRKPPSNNKFLIVSLASTLSTSLFKGLFGGLFANIVCPTS